MYYLQLCFKLEVFCSVTKYIFAFQLRRGNGIIVQTPKMITLIEAEYVIWKENKAKYPSKWFIKRAQKKHNPTTLVQKKNTRDSPTDIRENCKDRAIQRYCPCLPSTQTKIQGMRVSSQKWSFHISNLWAFLSPNTPLEIMRDCIPNAYTVISAKPTLPTS